MAKGGARPGAGRKPGIPNKRQKADTIAAAKTGILPKAVMLEAVRFHYARYEAELAKGEAADLKVVVDELHQAHDKAIAAAPYYDPRLQAVAHFGDGDKPENLSNARERLARLLDNEADAGKTAEAPPTAH